MLRIIEEIYLHSLLIISRIFKEFPQFTREYTILYFGELGTISREHQTKKKQEI